MNRTLLLAAGAVSWAVVAVDAALHLVNGDVLVPSVMAAVLIAWIGLRVVPARQARMTPVVADRG